MCASTVSPLPGSMSIDISENGKVREMELESGEENDVHIYTQRPSRHTEPVSCRIEQSVHVTGSCYRLRQIL